MLSQEASLRDAHVHPLAQRASVWSEHGHLQHTRQQRAMLQPSCRQFLQSSRRARRQLARAVRHTAGETTEALHPLLNSILGEILSKYWGEHSDMHTQCFLKLLALNITCVAYRQDTNCSDMHGAPASHSEWHTCSLRPPSIQDFWGESEHINIVQLQMDSRVFLWPRQSCPTSQRHCH